MPVDSLCFVFCWRRALGGTICYIFAFFILGLLPAASPTPLDNPLLDFANGPTSWPCVATLGPENQMHGSLGGELVTYRGLQLFLSRTIARLYVRKESF